MARCKRKDHQKWAGVAYVTPASPTNVLRPVAFRHPWRFWAQDGCIGRRRKGLRAPAPARRRAPPAKHPHRDGGSGPPRSALRARARGRTSPSWTRRGGRGGGVGSTPQVRLCSCIIVVLLFELNIETSRFHFLGLDWLGIANG